jgi:hypothetical protein
MPTEDFAPSANPWDWFTCEQPDQFEPECPAAAEPQGPAGGLDAFRAQFFQPPGKKEDDNPAPEDKPEPDDKPRPDDKAPPDKKPQEKDDDKEERDPKKWALDVARQTNIPVAGPEAEFVKNLEKFAERAKKMGLPEEKVVKTIEQIMRLTSAEPGKNVMPLAVRLGLAQQIIAHAADPTGIDQGSHGTCAAAAIEGRTYTLFPEQAARLIVDLALSGAYKTTLGGKEIDSKGSLNLAPEIDELKALNAHRTYASQLFQATAMNIYWTPRGGEYVQWPIAGQELVLDKSTGFTTIAGPGGGLDLKQIREIYSEITGDKNAAILHRRDEHSTVETHIKDIDQLKKVLEEAKSGKGELKFPLITGVHTSHNKFGDHFSGGGWHAVCITDYDPKTGQISVDNFWGRPRDYFGTKDTLACFTTQEMFEAMIVSNQREPKTEVSIPEALVNTAIIAIFLLGAKEAARLTGRLITNTKERIIDAWNGNREGRNAGEGKPLEVDRPWLRTRELTPEEKAMQRAASELPPQFSAQDLKAKLDELITRAETAAAVETAAEQATEAAKKASEAETKTTEALKKLRQGCEDPIQSKSIVENVARLNSEAAARTAGGGAQPILVSDAKLGNVSSQTGTIEGGVSKSRAIGEVAPLPVEYKKAIEVESEKVKAELAQLDERIKSNPENEALRIERLTAQAKLDGLSSVVERPAMRSKALDWIGRNGGTIGKGAGAGALIVFIYSLTTEKATAAEHIQHATIRRP